jgi:hypothetical protein
LPLLGALVAALGLALTMSALANRKIMPVQVWPAE